MEVMLAAKPVLGLVNIGPMLFFQVFNTLVLFAFLRWKLFGPISAILNKRTARIQSSFEEADNKAKSAEELRVAYEQKLAHIHDEETRIFAEARLKADRRANDMIKQVEAEIEKMKVHATQELERERERAMNQMKNEIVSMVVMTASKVIEKELDAAKHGALIDDVIQRVGETKWHN